MFGVGCLVFGVGFLVFGVGCWVFGVWCLVFGVWCLVLGVWCLVFGVWCWVFGCLEQILKRFLLGVWCWVFGAYQTLSAALPVVRRIQKPKYLDVVRRIECNAKSRTYVGAFRAFKRGDDELLPNKMKCKCNPLVQNDLPERIETGRLIG